MHNVYTKAGKEKICNKKELDKMYEEVKVMNIELLSYNKQLSELHSFSSWNIFPCRFQRMNCNIMAKTN